MRRIQGYALAQIQSKLTKIIRISRNDFGNKSFSAVFFSENNFFSETVSENGVTGVGFPNLFYKMNKK